MFDLLDGIVLQIGLVLSFGIVLDMRHYGFWMGDAFSRVHNFLAWVAILSIREGKKMGCPGNIHMLP